MLNKQHHLLKCAVENKYRGPEIVASKEILTVDIVSKDIQEVNRQINMNQLSKAYKEVREDHVAKKWESVYGE
jgi:hypothetical protein